MAVMSSWPVAWPVDVREFYESLAVQYGWPDVVVDGVAANVEYLRGLDESDRERVYLCGDDEEGSRWYFEAVEDRGELVPIRQVEIGDDSVHRYSWRRREDESGFLTDQAIDPGDGLERCEAAVFLEARESGA
jgi:hypothetical protein